MLSLRKLAQSAIGIAFALFCFSGKLLTHNRSLAVSWEPSPTPLVGTVIGAKSHRITDVDKGTKFRPRLTSPVTTPEGN